jgi:DNA-directed RNA polymerase subunit RPC12/RpoP
MNSCVAARDDHVPRLLHRARILLDNPVEATLLARRGAAEYHIPQVAFLRGPAMRYRCPACRRPAEAPDEEAGQQVQCPHCGEQFTLPRTLPPAPRPPAPAPSAATFPAPGGSGAPAAIRLTCPMCSQSFQAERVVGSCDVVCPRCGQTIGLSAVPQPSTALESARRAFGLLTAEERREFLAWAAQQL